MTTVLEASQKIFALLGLQSKPILKFRKKNVPNVVIQSSHILSLLMTTIPVARSSYETRKSYNHISSGIYVFVCFFFSIVIYVDLARKIEAIEDTIKFLQLLVSKSKFAVNLYFNLISHFFQ